MRAVLDGPPVRDNVPLRVAVTGSSDCMRGLLLKKQSEPVDDDHGGIG